MLRKFLTAMAATAALTIGSTAMAADSACKNIHLGQVSWPGVTAKTQTAAWILDQLGYETKTTTASVPIMFKSLSRDDLDVFMGLWLPTQRGMIMDYMKQGQIDIVRKNLVGAKYTVGVSRAAWEGGVHSFSDLADHIDKFDGTIYGIEAGNDGNKIIKDMISDDANGMGDFELKPSSTAGMLSEVKRRISRDKWVAFLAWAPHPMNTNIDFKFLNGGADYWGPNQGAATVSTQTRKGFAWQCPNVGQFLENYYYSVDEQSKLAAYMTGDGMSPAEAGQKMMRENPKLLQRWLGHGGSYQTVAVQNAAGDKEAKKIISNALKQ